MLLQLVLFLISAILINATFLLSFFIRWGLNIPELNYAPYRSNFVFLTVIYMLALVFARVFKKRFRSFLDLFKRIFMGLLWGTLFSIALVYTFRAQWSAFPTGIFIISFFMGLLLIFAFNGLVLRFAGRIKKKVVIIGNGNFAEFPGESSLVNRKCINNIEGLLQYGDIDEVVICERIYDDKQLNLLTYLLLKLKVSVVFSPTIYAKLLSANMLGENSVQFLATFIGRRSDWEEFLIRVLDILGSVFLLVLLSPLIGIVALFIKITSTGSVFYKQNRVSKDGRIFTMYKFKTMPDDTEKETGPVLAVENDPRVTRIGRFLRNTHINEIPQLFNVIRGEMSLVGPRPDRPYSVKQHKVLREIRLAVKPGLTGLAQIRSFYDLKPKHKVKYDYLYIQKRSLLLNLYILAKTIPVVFSRKGW